MTASPHPTVRAELVEALFFYTADRHVQGFDRLSPNGFGTLKK